MIIVIPAGHYGLRSQEEQSESQHAPPHRKTATAQPGLCWHLPGTVYLPKLLNFRRLKKIFYSIADILFMNMD